MSVSKKRDTPRQTLGDVLYANQPAPVVVEQDWVALVLAIARGDQVALHTLYGRSHRLVFTLVMRIVRDRETAEELTVDVYHDVWRRAGSYHADNGSVLGWIMNQARSRAIDQLRFQQRKKRVDPFPHAPSDEPATVDSQAEVELGESSRSVRAALDVLTPDEKHAIEAAFFGELTHVEVAKQLDEPVGTIKTRIRSGLSKLRDALGVEKKAP